MSFNSNYINNSINPGNYQEFFILYIDKELSNEQIKMVDDFLTANPDLRAEFEILMSTKLPVEEFWFDKENLLAENIKRTLIDEELLLYVDNELSAERKKLIELQLASNKEYQLQYQLLLQTQLNPSEKIYYPNKKELYRRTERVVALKPWMKIAAGIIVIAATSVFYFINSPAPVHLQPPVAETNNTSLPKPHATNQQQIIPDQSQSQESIVSTVKKKNNLKVNARRKIQDQQKYIHQANNTTSNLNEQNTIASVNPDELSTQRPTKIIGTKLSDRPAITLTDLSKKEIIGGTNVTSVIPVRNTNESLSSPDGMAKGGSVRGFLRKATRLIEKRTGFDATTNNGNELLLGSVAIQLK